MGYRDWRNETISLFTKFRELIKREKAASWLGNWSCHGNSGDVCLCIGQVSATRAKQVKCCCTLLAVGIPECVFMFL